MLADSSPPSSSRDASLGLLLIRLRTERGLAQKEVARLAAIDGSTLSRLESGDRGVSKDVLDRICGVLELDRDEKLNVLVAAGFLSPDAAKFLLDEQLSQLANLLTDPATAAADVARLRQFLTLALAFAEARGYRTVYNAPAEIL